MVGNNVKEIEDLIKIISKLPGLGPKSAKRIVLKLIKGVLEEIDMDWEILPSYMIAGMVMSWVTTAIALINSIMICFLY